VDQLTVPSYMLELQANWIPRQVTSCGAAEYVSYPNGWASICKQAKGGLSIDCVDVAPVTAM